MRVVSSLTPMVRRAIDGESPHLRPWHLQWLGVRDLNLALRRLLADAEGPLLDAGCGRKPYGRWLDADVMHVGIDLHARGDADVVVESDGRWPFRDGAFATILSTQVLQFVPDPKEFFAEALRCTAVNGRVIVSAPFMYGEHNLSADLWRFTQSGLASLGGDVAALEVRTQGGVGSTLALTLLTWVAASLSGRRAWLRVALAPVLWTVALTVNVLGVALNRVDGTGRFYHNTLVVLQR